LDLRNADLLDANLWGADLRNTDLRDANLWGADLRNADLRNANLWGTDLRNTDLRNANLRNANLRDADLRNADLRDADLRGTDLWGADLLGTDLRIYYGIYTVIVTPSNVQIGCECRTLEQWLALTETDAVNIDDKRVVEAVRQDGPVIKAMIEQMRPDLARG
jgi:hypothetical protein